MKELFLDANAHVPVNEAALKSLIKLNSSHIGHGHALSPSLIGRESAAALEDARAKFASLIGARSANQIIFTSGCTQACEWAMEIMNQMGKTITISPLEHPAVSMACEKYFKKINYIDATLGKSSLLNLNYNGAYELVSCVHMQNEIGTIQPIKNIKSKFLMSDMSQSLGKEPVDVTDLGVDLAVFGAHKFGGFSGVGMMYLKDTAIWKEFGSGSRYFMDSSGTPNTIGIIASVDGLEQAIKSILGRRAKMREFKTAIEPVLEEMKFQIIAKEVIRCPNTTFCRTPKSGDAIRLLKELGDRGIFCGLGSACGSLHTGGSPLMQRLNCPSDGMDYLRISQFGEYGTLDAKQFVTILKKIL